MAASLFERFAYFGIRTLVLLYLLRALFETPESLESVLGGNFLKNGIEYFFGPMGLQTYAQQIFGVLLSGFTMTPLLLGFFSDRYLGKSNRDTGARACSCSDMFY